MKKILLFLLILGFGLSAVATGADKVYTIMKPDWETMQKWAGYYEAAPKMPMAKLFKEAPRGSRSLLEHLNYIPAERDQGACGNCWSWAGTGCMEIALDVQDNVFDRLSVQYISSCETEVIGKTCCEGGWLEDVKAFYAVVGKAIPWANENAYYQDGDASCDTSCDSIELTPNYPINHINALSIVTRGVSKAQAIANIKSALDQNIAVWLAFYLPTSDDWNMFSDFWGNNNEAKLWNPDFSCGKNWQEGGGGGHAVLCVGYNDDDPNNSYWIIVNSWGNADGLRPNGIFHLDMNLNYECTFKYNSADSQSLYWQMLDIDWNVVHPTPTPIPGENCSVAIDASLGIEYTGSTANMTNNFDPSSGKAWPYTWTMQGPDCVFKIDIPNPAQATNVQARVTSADFDQALYMMSDCSDPIDSLLCSVDQYADATGEQLSCPVSSLNTVYLVLDSYHNKVAGAFTIEIKTSGFGPTPTPTASPTPTPTPTPTPNLMPEEHTYTFDSGKEGWNTLTIPPDFDEPLFLEETGKIGFSPNGSANCYGSWESPYHAFTVGQKYRARFLIQTNQSDQSKVPGFRIRIQDKKSQVISFQMINSLGDGANSPTLSGMTYEVLFQPPQSALMDGYLISVDLINIGNADDPNAKIYIDTVEIKKVTVTSP